MGLVGSFLTFEVDLIGHDPDPAGETSPDSGFLQPHIPPEIESILTDAVEVPPDGSVAFDALAKSLIDTAGDPDRFTFRPVVTSRPVAGADPAEISELLAELRD